MGKPLASPGACELLPALGASPQSWVLLLPHLLPHTPPGSPQPQAEPHCCQKLRMPQPTEPQRAPGALLAP